jgi:fucose 4-O-acetylase-like acetyltransferase
MEIYVLWCMVDESAISKIKTRDNKFDVLRIIGLLCIILAHTNPSGILFQLRNFDVPLMVMVSGAVFGYSASNNKLPYLKYAKKTLYTFNSSNMDIPIFVFHSYIFSLHIY